MGSRMNVVRRSIVVELIFMVSILCACSDASTSPGATNTGTPQDIEVAYCSGAPRWVAFQDGDGPWTQALPSISGQHIVFRHTFTSRRAGFATVQVFQSGLTSLNVQYALPAELGLLGDTLPSHCGPAVSRTLLGTVAGLGTSSLAIISVDPFATVFATPNDVRPFALRGLPAGPVDILAVRATEGPAAAVTSIILRRTPDLPDSTTLPVLDFDSPEAFAPATATVTLVGGGTEGITARSGLRTAHVEGLHTFVTAPAGDTRTYYAIPESQLAPTDLQFIFAASNPVSTAGVRSATIYFRAPVNQTLALGAPPIDPTFTTVSSGASLRLRVTFPTQSDYDRAASVTFQQLQSTLVTVGVTAEYATQSGNAFTLTIPDLTGVSGFDSRWALQPGTDLQWTASRIGGTLGVGQNVVPTNGSIQRSAVSSGIFTP